MTQSEFPTSWTDPQYVATVVGLLAFGALVFYSATSSSLAVEEVTFVVLALTLPMTAAYELARRVG
jgi:hypothetical protein